MLNAADEAGLGAFLARQADAEDGAILAPGAVIGGWRVTGLLGRGGSGEVYRVVRGAETGALKILAKDADVDRKRFLAEVEFLRLVDRNLSLTKMRCDAVAGDPECRPYPFCRDSGDCDGRPYFVMELLEPADMPDSEKGIASYLLEVCACVRALHQLGLVHRDLKPKNIMRRANGEVVLIDFGLAKDVVASPNPRADISIVSDRPVCAGTPEYAAPEQMVGGEVSRSADIHALGRIANNAFNGNPPRTWREIIRRSTSSIPEQRYPSVDEFAAAIRHRNLRAHIAICVLAFVLLAGGAALAWLSGRRLPEEIAWERLCGEAVSTNVVREELVSVTWLDKGGLKVPAERRYRQVTNRVEVVKIDLGGVTNVFANPMWLKGGIEYWVTGPGVLDGTFKAEGMNVTMRLRNCIVRNHAAEPLGKVGIAYDLQNGAGLDLPDLDEPDDHGRHHIERSGSPTRLTFKGTGL